MLKICKKYDWDILEKCPRYDWDMHDTWYMPDIFLGYIYEICLRHVWDIPDNVYKICIIYAWDLPEI